MNITQNTAAAELHTQAQKKNIIRLFSNLIAPLFPLLLQYKTFKLVYRRYAGLYFLLCVDVTDNELLYLETVHLFVEVRSLLIQDFIFSLRKKKNAKLLISATATAVFILTSHFFSFFFCRFQIIISAMYVNQTLYLASTRYTVSQMSSLLVERSKKRVRKLFLNALKKFQHQKRSLNFPKHFFRTIQILTLRVNVTYVGLFIYLVIHMDWKRRDVARGTQRDTSKIDMI